MVDPRQFCEQCVQKIASYTKFYTHEETSPRDATVISMLYYNSINEHASGSRHSGLDASLLSDSRPDLLTKKTPSLSEIKVLTMRSHVGYDQSNGCLYVA